MVCKSFYLIQTYKGSFLLQKEFENNIVFIENQINIIETEIFRNECACKELIKIKH